MKDSKFKMTSCFSTLIYHNSNFLNYYSQTNNGIENIIYRILSHTSLSIDPHNNLKSITTSNLWTWKLGLQVSRESWQSCVLPGLNSPSYSDCQSSLSSQGFSSGGPGLVGTKHEILAPVL